MKGLLSVICLLALCLSGCGGGRVTKAPEEIAQEVLADLQGAEFTPCDDDYVENSFAFDEAPRDCALYFGNEFGLEFGIFAFQDNATARREAGKIEEYLAREEASVRDLAALYPAAELSARLDRYAGASVRIKGNTVAYFLLSETDRTAAEAAFVRTAR